MSPGYWSALRNFGRKRGRGRGRSSLSSSSRRLVSTGSGSIVCFGKKGSKATSSRSEEHTSELQSLPPRPSPDLARARTGKVFPFVVIQEAGLDGFWIDRVLRKEGIESHVVEIGRAHV